MRPGNAFETGGGAERAWEDHMLGSGHSTGRMVAGLYLCRGCRKMLTGSWAVRYCLSASWGLAGPSTSLGTLLRQTALLH